MIKFLTDIKNRNFRRLWLAQIISQFGDRIHQLALVGLIAERAPGSVTGLAKLLAFTILPVFIIQPVAGAFVDRWDRRTTLFVCDMARFLLVLTIPFAFIYHESMIPIYIMVFLVFAFSRFYVPAKMSIIPDLVEEDNLFMANSLVTTSGMIAFVLGCAAGGFLIDHYGARTGFIIDACTYLASAVFVFSINVPISLNKEKIMEAGKEIVGELKKSVWVEMKEGIRYLIQHRELRFIINTVFVLFAAAGAIYVVIIVFIQKSFESVTKDLGVLAVCLGIGLFIGALMYGKWGKKFRWYKTIFFCLVVGGVMLSVFAIVVQNNPNLAVAMVLSAILGLVVGPIIIAANTIIHLVSDNQMRGKVFSALEVVIHFAFLIAMLASAWMATFVPEGWILVGVGALFAFVGLLGFLAKPKFVVAD